MLTLRILLLCRHVFFALVLLLFLLVHLLLFLLLLLDLLLGGFALLERGGGFPLLGLLLPDVEVVEALLLHGGRLGEDLDEEVVARQTNAADEADLRGTEFYQWLFNLVDP